MGLETMLKPLKQVFDRTNTAKQESDTAYFYDLLMAGELLLKLTVAGFVACIQDEPDRYRYQYIHRLIRADGIGEWSDVLGNTVTGVAYQHLTNQCKEDRRTLTERVGEQTWQFDAVTNLKKCLALISGTETKMPDKVAILEWFNLFPQLRNKTRGHGALLPEMCSKLCLPLETSIKLLAKHIPIFDRQWVYLHRNLSGKYRITAIGNSTTNFDHLGTNEVFKSTTGHSYPDGIYIFSDEPKRAELISSSPDLVDYFFPNGAFKNKKYESLSLISGDTIESDASAYMSPASQLPNSETHGLGELDLIGMTWSNMPTIPNGYVNRPTMEERVRFALTNDRHPVVTLVGRGGIGKTSLALDVLGELAKQDRFKAIVWFSARDIDLLPSGPKSVRPAVLSERDIAEELVKLMQPDQQSLREFSPQKYMADLLNKSNLDGPILFVFDNFETSRSPIDLFNWIDAHCRLPNKVLITTRFREFKADYPIEIEGMELAEAKELISKTAASLGLKDFLKTNEIDQIIEDSDGHPYIMKVMLGEIARTRTTGKPANIIARKEEVLDALFERTYSSLTPTGKRVFLTLCSWRSLVPTLALEAVLLRPDNERMDIKRAIEELQRMSLVQFINIDSGPDFLEVPLAAAIFGQRKLISDPLRTSIENDVKLLQEIGPTARSGIRSGIEPKIKNIFRRAAERITTNKGKIEEYLPILEFLAKSYPEGWLLLAEIHDETAGKEKQEKIISCLRFYIESTTETENLKSAWRKLSSAYQRNNMFQEALDASIRAIELPVADIRNISTVANNINTSKQSLESLTQEDRNRFYRRVVTIMEPRIDECLAIDLSRLAWLHLHLNDARRAYDLAQKGIKLDPNSEYCTRILEKLEDQKKSW
jgi:tetratricopeptide (TPR) repeat protein